MAVESLPSSPGLTSLFPQAPSGKPLAGARGLDAEHRLHNWGHRLCTHWSPCPTTAVSSPQGLRERTWRPSQVCAPLVRTSVVIHLRRPVELTPLPVAVAVICALPIAIAYACDKALPPLLE